MQNKSFVNPIMDVEREMSASSDDVGVSSSSDQSFNYSYEKRTNGWVGEGF